MPNVDNRLAEQGFDPAEVHAIVERALAEDLGAQRSDPTSESIFGLDVTGNADLVARESGTVAGLTVAETVFGHVDTAIGFAQRVFDGQRIYAGDVLATVAGPVRHLLMAERTVLNLLSRMSGVATHTCQWARLLEGTGTTVLDTRKTTPGLRSLDKYAVRSGGGGNKRMGLYDVAMIKDNHKFAAGSVTAAFNAVRAAHPDIDIQLEVDTLAEAQEAVTAGAKFLLCDNMSPEQLREVVDAVGPGVELEATGNITLATAEKYAVAGVDYISSGALTHSSPILDIALDIKQE